MTTPDIDDRNVGDVGVGVSTGPVFVKVYAHPRMRPPRAPSRLARWPGLRYTRSRSGDRPARPTRHRLIFAHLGHQQPRPGDLRQIAHALGRRTPPRTGQSCTRLGLRGRSALRTGLVIPISHIPRQNLRQFGLQVAGLAAAFTKTPTSETSSRGRRGRDHRLRRPDPGPIWVRPRPSSSSATAMTHGRLDPVDIRASTPRPTTPPPRQRAPATTCTVGNFHAYAEVHGKLTAPYLHRNGYTYAWPTVGPGPPTKLTMTNEHITADSTTPRGGITCVLSDSSRTHQTNT